MNQTKTVQNNTVFQIKACKGPAGQIRSAREWYQMDRPK